jgi:hypothetical protein
MQNRHPAQIAIRSSFLESEQPLSVAVSRLE